MHPQLTVQHRPSILRYKYDVVLAVPLRVALAFYLVHPVSSFRLLGGSRLEVSAMDTHTYANVKLLLSPRQSRGITYWIYGAIFLGMFGFDGATGCDYLGKAARGNRWANA